MQSPISNTPQPVERKKFPFGNLIKALLALILIWLVFSKTNFSEVLALRDKISFPWLAWTFLLYVSLTFFKAFQYYFLIDRKTPYLRVVSIVVWQNALTNFVAAGAGVASYLALFKAEENVKFSRATLAFLITKVGDLFSVWVVFIVCNVFLWDEMALFHSISFFLIGSIGLGLLFFGAIIVFRRRFISWLGFVFKKIRLTKFSLAQKSMGILSALAMQDPVTIYKTVGQAFTLSFVYYLMTLAWMMAGMRMLAAPVSGWSIIFVSCILQLVSIVPITIFGSLGVTEFTSLYLYEIFGVSQTVMSPVLLAWRVIFYLTNLLVLLYLPVHALFFSKSSR